MLAQSNLLVAKYVRKSLRRGYRGGMQTGNGQLKMAGLCNAETVGDGFAYPVGISGQNSVESVRRMWHHYRFALLAVIKTSQAPNSVPNAAKR